MDLPRFYILASSHLWVHLLNLTGVLVFQATYPPQQEQHLLANNLAFMNLTIPWMKSILVTNASRVSILIPSQSTMMV
uniref:Uncharacterized protein MANES_14G045000 n=1 Tax=Rhizophora mucronata TaxID=61149 RepID=A0A2P2M970_RHIMU